MSECAHQSPCSCSAAAAGAHGPAPSEALPAILDRTHLRRYTMGEQALENEVLGLFVDQVLASLAELRSAGSATQWQRAAHTLKGSSAAVGAARLAACLQEAEKIPSADDATQRQSALVRIEAEARLILDFLGKSHT